MPNAIEFNLAGWSYRQAFRLGLILNHARDRILPNRTRIRLISREALDDAIAAGAAQALVGQPVEHWAARGGAGLVVEMGGHYLISALVKCHQRGCRHYARLYFSSGLHHGAFCYVVNPRTHEYLANLRDEIVVCRAHSRRENVKS